MTITYNFDEIIDRRASDSIKWATETIFNQKDAIPMWVADMDFRYNITSLHLRKALPPNLKPD
jgi:bifunctional pyridoxal-dependent enzyme with beta-cystathionase and maltose regulon repressor activities